MPTIRLPERALVLVSGPDAEAFLQNILTLDLAGVGERDLKPGALLTPQGKILFDFLVSRLGDGFRFDLPRANAADFARRLMLYRLRAKAEITIVDEALVAVSFGDDLSALALVDRRFADGAVIRGYGEERAAQDDPGPWTQMRITHGVAESGADYALGDAFPHDVLLDQNGGVDFRKGCYVGQEVVSRMQHRGTARRRVTIAEGDGPLPPAGTAITVDDRPVGALGSTIGARGLALVRIDKVKAAMDEGRPILADKVALRLSIPAFARFGWPQDAADPAA